MDEEAEAEVGGWVRSRRDSDAGRESGLQGPLAGAAAVRREGATSEVVRDFGAATRKTGGKSVCEWLWGVALVYFLWIRSFDPSRPSR